MFGPRRATHDRKRSLSPRRAFRRNRSVAAQPLHCAAAHRDRFRPNNEKFLSFRHGDTRTGVGARAKADNDRLWSAKLFRYSVEILKQGSRIFSVVRPFTGKFDTIII